jgi:hypothetical protein
MMGGGGNSAAAAKPPAAKEAAAKPKPVMKKQEAVVEVAGPQKDDLRPAADITETAQLPQQGGEEAVATAPAAVPKIYQSQEASSSDTTATAGQVVTKAECLDSKKSVTFEETTQEEEEETARRLLQERAKEERHINRTRTMRPKEKWEWAFNRILKNLEVGERGGRTRLRSRVPLARATTT